MQGSKQFLKDHNVRPKISFKEVPKHTVKLLKDKVETREYQGQKNEGVKFLVEENGEQKEFFTASQSLIEKLAKYKEGDEVVIEMRSVKNNAGAFISVFVVMTPTEAETQEQIMQNTQAAQTAEATEAPEQAPEVEPEEPEIPEIPETPEAPENEINVEDIPF